VNAVPIVLKKKNRSYRQRGGPEKVLGWKGEDVEKRKEEVCGGDSGLPLL